MAERALVTDYQAMDYFEGVLKITVAVTFSDETGYQDQVSFKVTVLAADTDAEVNQKIIDAVVAAAPTVGHGYSIAATDVTITSLIKGT